MQSIYHSIVVGSGTDSSWDPRRQIKICQICLLRKMKIIFFCISQHEDWWSWYSRLLSLFTDERLRTTKSEALKSANANQAHFFCSNLNAINKKSHQTTFGLEQNGPKLSFIKWTMLIGLCQPSLEHFSDIFITFWHTRRSWSDRRKITFNDESNRFMSDLRQFF